MRTLALLFTLLLGFGSAHADQLIVNGGFETGLTGWLTGSNGDGGFFANSGTATPLTFNSTVGASSGSFYAVSDDYSGSQTSYLRQFFTTPSSFQTATLSFAMFVNDIYGADFGSSGPGAQVQLLNSVGSVIATLFGPVDTFENPVGNPNPYLQYSSNISFFLNPNTTYGLQFSNTDITNLINVGVDNVSIVTTNATAVTPEPTTLSLVGLGSVLLAWTAFYKKAA